MDFFETRRASSDDVYPSEWFFLGERIREGISILDIGCAQGGFAAVIGEHLGTFSYTGVDISSEMVSQGKGETSRPHLPPCRRGRLLRPRGRGL
jgi:2-polyprenyl-3-methyl-5-hydroxy-6-metoxy-1,4-benzoquinol methylase